MSHKKGEDSPMRHSPVRPFSRHSRDSPVEESETERAFQRLLQVQGVSSVPKSSNGTMDSLLTGKQDVSRSSKTDLTDRSPKHSNPDGRNTPKSMLIEKCNTVSPNLSGSVSIAKVNQMDYKRPLTPKLDTLTKMENSVYVSQAPMESPVSASLTSTPSSTTPSSASLSISSCSSTAITNVLFTLAAGGATMTSTNAPSSKGMAHKVAPCSKQSSSPSRKESSSPEDSLVIDYPNTPSHKSPERKLHKLPLMAAPCLEPLVSQTKSPAEARMPVSPVQQLKSPAQPSPGIRSPAVASTPQSEHSNPSSVAHSSPYDIDDELMDEALVGLGK